ncbi:MAG TPA: hypothetical protein VGM41_07175 [Chitinophagaceae bacterium]|jgi:hypothetical protein
MNKQQNIEDRLWDYIDGSCTDEEKKVVEQLIATQEAWRVQYHALLEVNQVMQQSLELEEPSMRFSQNVMEEIARHHIAPATKTYINKKIIYGIGIFFFSLVAAVFIYGLSQVNWSVAASGGGSILDTYMSTKIDWSRFFNNTWMTVFLLVSSILGLMLLDIYLGRKRRRLRQATDAE